MSNLTNFFLEGHTPAEALALVGDLLQGKHDKRGGIVAAEGNNIRIGADRANLVDDMILLLINGQLGDVTPAFEYYDSGAINVDAITNTGGGTPTYAASVDITTGHNVLEMYAVSYYLLDTAIPQTNVDGLDLEFFQDAGLTRKFSKTTFFEVSIDQVVNPAGATIAARGRLMFEPVGGTRRIYFRFSNNSASVSYLAQAMRIWGRLFTLDETIIADPPE